ncbi:DUF3078 domain-containing protein [Dysgonomonas sp. 520]|uniref:DUF3078 domain-containing protein n=1 Tax=Dysgonomonas sp. 520 TaxID=2302931 RepID=UPI0013D7B396|nr:DUF3078 domain-containing protein [Dysgonomonas sp. 520]NDW09013.1 DUF3078 domain-containing protein [Dysgonomonas sp. 520]
MKQFIFCISIIIIFIVFSGRLNAQIGNVAETNAKNVSLLSDSLYSAEHTNKHFLQRGENGLIVMPQNDWLPFNNFVSFKDTMFIEPYFLPVVFDGRVLPRDLSFTKQEKKSEIAPDFHLISPDSTFAPMLDRMKLLKNLRQNYYLNHPDLVNYNALAFDQVSDSESTIPKQNVFRDLISVERNSTMPSFDLEKYETKKVFWLKNGEHSLQVSQTRLSKNWASGGKNNFSIQNYHKINLNYKRKKVWWNNTFEWKVNLQQTPADTINKVSVTEDFLRLYSVFGLDAYKKWSYTVNLEAKTPIFNGYPVNSAKRITSFLSPLQVNVGAGMSYSFERKSKVNKYRNTKFSADLAPISIQYKYVEDDKVDETRFGIKKGKKANTAYGSTINANLTYNYNQASNFTSRFKYFSNYESVVVESENKFTMSLNRFFSTSIYLYLRFDDSVDIAKKDRDLGYFQYNEILGFGLNYKW